MDIQRKAFRLFITIFLIYGFLVATHEGEFWPYSIYPMFSQAGKTWTRSMVRDVSEVQINDSTIEKTITELEKLPGKPFPMNKVGINQNDVSNFIEKAEDWNEVKFRGMRKLFETELEHRELLIYKVQGKLSGEASDSVIITYTPFLMLNKERSILFD